MWDSLGGFFDSTFMPHGHCYRWEAGLVWLHAGSDSLIALAYYSIPFFLVYLVYKRRDLAFKWMFLLFGTFILACGTTHLLEVWSIWHGTYWLTGTVKLATGLVSISTAVLLVPLMPRALALPSPAMLRQANQALAAEVQERKRSEEALRESEERFRSAFDYAPVGMALVAPDGSWMEVNQSLCQMLGYTEDELVQTNFQALTHPDDLEEDLAYVQQMLARRIDAYQMEKRYRHRQGHYVWATLGVSLVRDPAQRVKYFIAQVLDISEQKQAAEALARANTVLQQRNEELQEFAHVASHDLQEPLRKIHAFADLLHDEYHGRVEETGQFYLERIRDAAARMSRLISELLAYSRVTTRARPFEQVDLNEVVQNVRSDLMVRIREEGGTVEIGSLPTLMADATQMHQLLQNLIGNALKFHDPGANPVVRVSGQIEAAADQAVCRISVSDNGIGFEEKYADRIFSPFQRLHGRSAFDGTGMGLAICRRIVERHGGRITVHSTPGQGSTFIVTLPLHQTTAPDHEDSA